MKKVLLILRSMDCGGVEQSCLNFINEMKKFYKIDLLLLNKKGAFLNKIDKSVNIFEANDRYKIFTIFKNDLKNVSFKMKVLKYIKYFLDKLGMKKIFLKRALRNEKFYNYDICIAYNQDLPLVDIALNRVVAEKKFIILHGALDLSDKTKFFINNLKKFDKIFCVSDSCRKELSNFYGDVDKFDTLFNMQNVKEINLKSLEAITYDKNNINLLTIGRLSAEKGIARVPFIIKHLDKYNNLKWNFVGDGPLKNDIEKRITKNGDFSKVKFWGFTDNSYKYIKNADLIVILSYSEAAPMIINESFILGVPVLSTRTVSADEMIGDYGFVCDNNDEAIVEKLKYILDNPNLIKEKKELLKSFNYNNNEIIEKIRENM